MDDHEMFMVVGFEVQACSIQRSPGQKPQNIRCDDTQKTIKPQEVTKGNSYHLIALSIQAPALIVAVSSVSSSAARADIFT